VKNARQVQTKDILIGVELLRKAATGTAAGNQTGEVQRGIHGGDAPGRKWPKPSELL
jgi:hypothetical protein